jgi:hypothetical protein
MANLFLQVPVSVLLVMATPESRFRETEPYAGSQITQDFMVLGLPCQRLLPEIALPESVVSPLSYSGAKSAPPEGASARFAYHGAATEVYPHVPPQQQQEVEPMPTPVQSTVNSDDGEIEVAGVRSSELSYRSVGKAE